MADDFETIVNTYSRQVLNTAIRILGDTNLALDVHQEVFLAIWQRWHSFNGQTNWPGYLYRTTVRKAIELANKQKKETSIDDDFEKASNDKPHQRLEADELRHIITKAISRLPDKQADAFVLAKIEGLKADEIAKILQCSEDTVRVHLHRAVKTLAEKLGNYLKK